jgi:hypothetical protein
MRFIRVIAVLCLFASHTIHEILHAYILSRFSCHRAKAQHFLQSIYGLFCSVFSRDAADVLCALSMHRHGIHVDCTHGTRDHRSMKSQDYCPEMDGHTCSAFYAHSQMQAQSESVACLREQSPIEDGMDSRMNVLGKYDRVADGYSLGVKGHALVHMRTYGLKQFFYRLYMSLFRKHRTRFYQYNPYKSSTILSFSPLLRTAHKLALLVMACLILPVVCHAQSTSAISGTVRDLSNAVVTSGDVTFELVPGIDTTASGIARFTPSTVTCTITALGAVKALDGISTCTITQNTSLAPPNTAYKACIRPQFISPGSCFIMYATTSSIDITTVTPTPSQMPSYNLVDTFSNQSIAGNKTFTGNITFGGTLSLGAITLGGNLNMGGNSITNANAGTFSGNVSVGGTLGVTGAITAASYTTPNANPATAGIERLAVGDTECWRNFANGGNVCLSDAGAASSTTGNLADLMKWSGGGFQGAAFVDQSAAPANSGVLRVGNNVVAVAARNAASGADLTLLQSDASNNAQIAPPIRQVEQAAPSGVASSDLLWADSTSHRWKMINNNGTAANVSTGGPTFQQFTGTGTFTIPAGVTAVKVTIVGGGAGGGGSTATNNGGGGGSGGIAIKWLTGLTPGNTIAVTIGAAGTAGATGATGGSGGNSTIASGTQAITTVTAFGGSGGNGNGTQSTGGAGGVVSTNGDINLGGNAGFDGIGISGGPGGGAFGGGAPSSNGGQVGNPATSFGGAGGGAGAGGNRSGGAGAAGLVIFEWVT